MKKEIEMFREFIYEIKYRSHNPEHNCDCETCKVCNELLEKIITSQEYEERYGNRE